MRFLGVDLAWKDGNPSGIALLGGQKFPLHLREVPHTISSHPEIHRWIGAQVRHHRAAVGIDAPLLGLTDPPKRREADDSISRAFGKYHASTHSPSRFPDLVKFTDRITRDYETGCFSPGWKPGSRKPAIREVYPNALQVLLFGLDRKPGLRILKYKQKHFGAKRAWVERGLLPFTTTLQKAVAGRWIVPSGAEWKTLISLKPHPSMTGSELKSIEDRWDAVMCALAVALEFYAPGTMRPYPGFPDDWRSGYVLAPSLM